MESHLLDEPAVRQLRRLDRRSEGFSDLAPGDPDRPSCNHGVNDLMLSTGTSQQHGGGDIPPPGVRHLRRVRMNLRDAL